MTARRDEARETVFSCSRILGFLDYILASTLSGGHAKFLPVGGSLSLESFFFVWMASAGTTQAAMFGLVGDYRYFNSINSTVQWKPVGEQDDIGRP